MSALQLLTIVSCALLQADKDVMEFPDIFKGKDTAEGKNAKEYKKLTSEVETERRKTWSQQDLPQWFR